MKKSRSPEKKGIESKKNGIPKFYDHNEEALR
jgi:hypothetical protein